MDPSGVLKNEIFRPFASVIVPGSIAVTPYVLLLSHFVPATGTFFLAHSNAFIAAMLVVIVATGFLLENLGSQIECFIDRKLLKKYPDRETVWYAYLRLKISDEYVGQRYLRTLVLRLKFELSMVPALILFGIALYCLNCIYLIWSMYTLSVILILIVGLICWLLCESQNGAKLLGTVRKELVAEVRGDAA